MQRICACCAGATEAKLLPRGRPLALALHPVRSTPISRPISRCQPLTTVTALLLVLGAAPAAPAAAQRPADLAVRADSLWRAGATDSAVRLYHVILAPDSLASSRAVYRIATSLAWAAKTDRALALYSRYERMEPTDWGGPLARSRTQAWAGRYKPSLATLDSLARARPEEQEVALLRAQVLAWAGDLAPSANRYREWLARHTDDDEARAGLARTLSWDGRFDEAEAEYRALATRAPAEGTKGLARIAAWRGNLRDAEQQWAATTAAYPKDPETWVGLALVQRWQGRARDADRSLAAALRVTPGYPDAISQRAYVRAELEPAVDPVLAYTNDSDQNRVTTLSVAGSIAPSWQGRAFGVVQWRQGTLGPTTGSSATVRGGATWTPIGSPMMLRAELGMSFLSRSISVGGTPRSGPASQVLYALRASGPLTSRVSVGLALAGGAFDETAVLIAGGVRTDGVDADVTVVLPARLTLSGGAGWMRVGSGTVANQRAAFSGALRYAVTRASWVGVVARTFGYDTLAAADGYFSPQRFSLAEVAAHFELPRDLGWNVAADAGIGAQEIRVGSAPSSGKDAQRAAIALLYRPRPGTEYSAGLWIANVASPFAATSEYRAGGLSLRGRVGF